MANNYREMIDDVVRRALLWNHLHFELVPRSRLVIYQIESPQLNQTQLLLIFVDDIPQK